MLLKPSGRVAASGSRGRCAALQGAVELGPEGSVRLVEVVEQPAAELADVAELAGDRVAAELADAEAGHHVARAAVAEDLGLLEGAEDRPLQGGGDPGALERRRRARRRWRRGGAAGPVDRILDVLERRPEDRGERVAPTEEEGAR